MEELGELDARRGEYGADDGCFVVWLEGFERAEDAVEGGHFYGVLAFLKNCDAYTREIERGYVLSMGYIYATDTSRSPF